MERVPAAVVAAWATGGGQKGGAGEDDRRAAVQQHRACAAQVYLHADGYSRYHKLEDNTKILVVGCWTHARRKFDEALKGLSEKARAGSLALRAKQYCDKLFALEREFAVLTPGERLLEREKRAKPFMQEFFSWLGKQKISTKSAFGNAAQYVLGQKKYLSRYLLDGNLEISNNRAERNIRPFVIGRKNFLFANTPRGAQTSAILYSIVETAKESGLDPYAYLVWVFKTAPGLDLGSRSKAAEMLLPEYAPEECRARGGHFEYVGEVRHPEEERPQKILCKSE